MPTHPPSSPRADYGSRPTPAWADRLVASTVVIVAVWLVVTLRRVAPDGRGHGTHEQLGMPPCSWPLPEPFGYGLPCPTCGCTTAAAKFVQLSPWDAIVTQPFGAAVAAAGVGLALVALWSLIRGQSFVERLARWPYATILIVAIVLLLGSWGYKVWVWPRGD